MTSRIARKKKESAATVSKMDWKLVERVLDAQSVRTLYLYGPPGIGKTYCAYTKGRLANGVFIPALSSASNATADFKARSSVTVIRALSLGCSALIPSR